MEYHENIVEIAKYPGYGVSSDGRVWSRRPINGKGPLLTKWREVKPLRSSTGYLQVGIDRKKVSVHVLVAEGFLGPCPDGMEVAHRNGIGTCNGAYNLAYKTHSDNEKDKREHGTSPAGSRNAAAKLDERTISIIRAALRTGKRGDARKLAALYDVSESTISMIRSGKRWEEF